LQHLADINKSHFSTLYTFFTGRARVQHVVEDGQFSDIDAGCPFWESDEKKFSKSSNVWKSSENKNLRVPKKHNVIPGGLDIGKQ
jgi:hypothetical protein